MQNRTHHKTTPNSTSERPSGLTVSVTLEDAWPKQTWGWRPEVAKEHVFFHFYPTKPFNIQCINRIIAKPIAKLKFVLNSYKD